MKSVIIHRTGLWTGTGPDDDLCGARPRLELLARTIHADLLVIAWDDPDAKQKLAEASANYQFQVRTGHSHGASAECTEALFAPARSLDVVAIIDDCPPGNPAGHMVEELDPPASAKTGCAFWQHNSEPSGIAFKKNSTFEVYNVSAWRNARGRKLGHIDFPLLQLESIAGDDSVWDIIESITLRQFHAAWALANRETGGGGGGGAGGKVLQPLPDDAAAWRDV